MFEKGNKIWQLADPETVGRKQKICLNSLIIANENYKQSKKNNEPYLISELCKYIGLNPQYFNQTKNSLILETINNIKNNFYNHNIELYKKGLISINLVARQLKDKQRIEVEINETNFKIKEKINDVGFNHLLPQTGYIYFVKSNCSNYYKIGFSTNPKRRLRDIAQVLPFKLDVIIVRKNMFALNLELTLHEKYKKFLIKNEWFAFTKKEEKEVYKILSKN